jgi:hypothetical protein
MYRTCRRSLISTGPTSTYVALRGMSFVRPRNLRCCVGRPFHVDGVSGTSSTLTDDGQGDQDGGLPW